jgi:ABC-type transport system involved in multi-copper enzyme maturation permease subunit
MTTAWEVAPPMRRLTAVELRKLVDTRAGRWLLITIGLLAAAVAAIQIIAGGPETETFANFFGASVVPIAVLLPVLGILLVTSEWSQRTALTTFSLVPRRHRVVVAKIVAATLAAVASVAASLLVAALATLISAATGGAGDWSFRWAFVGYAVIAQVISVLMGVGFGMVLLNSALAIVVYLVLPTAWTILGATIRSLDKVAAWLDTSVTTATLFEPGMTAGLWARLGVSVAVWVLLPLAAGMVRVATREVA